MYICMQLSTFDGPDCTSQYHNLYSYTGHLIAKRLKYPWTLQKSASKNSIAINVISPQSPLTSFRHFIEHGFENIESFDDTKSNLDEDDKKNSKDPSVDVTNLSRSELLSRLPQKTSNSKQVTEKLRPKLRKYIKIRNRP